MDHGDMVLVSGISEENESAETAHDLQMNWTHGENSRLSNRECLAGGQASGLERGVRRHLAVSDPGQMSVSRRSPAGSTALTDAAICSC